MRSLSRFASPLAMIAAVALVPSVLAGGGDDASTATPIAALPFADTDDTTTRTDQFDLVCPFTGSTSPDAWYQYAAAGGELLEIRLCDSAYDTKVYVLDEAFNEVACNDDACGGNFRSELVTPALSAGTHYIVVDGWSGDAGVYDLTVELGEACAVSCPDGSTPEGEPCDDTGGTDTNGGCNSDRFVIQSVACGDVICGEAWAIDGTRDTDWFELEPSAPFGDVQATLTTGFDAAFFFLGEDPDCSSVSIGPQFTNGCGGVAEYSVSVLSPDAVTWWVVAKSNFDLLPCGSDGAVNNAYILEFECLDGPPAPCPALGDTNSDGFVDFADLLTLLANFGPCP